MSAPSPFNVLVVGQGSLASDLRALLIEQGATVHVVSVRAAHIMARRKRIDAAFVTFTMDEQTADLCAFFVKFGISFVFFGPDGVGLPPSKQRLRAMETEIEVPSPERTWSLAR
jgi:hypothetical protein